MGIWRAPTRATKTRYYRTLGKNLYQAMQDIYREFGFHHNRTVSYTFEGSAGAEAMASIMAGFRENPLTEVAGLKVEQYLDYQQGVGGLPSANVLEFDLEQGNKVIVRPSGTEPKVKVYLFTVGESAASAEKLADSLSAAMAKHMN